MTGVTLNLTGVILHATAVRSRMTQVFFKSTAVMLNLTGVILRMTAIASRMTGVMLRPRAAAAGRPRGVQQQPSDLLCLPARLLRRPPGGFHLRVLDQVGHHRKPRRLEHLEIRRP